LWEVINNEGYHKTITVKKSPSGRFYLSISLYDPDKDSDKPSVPLVNAVGLEWGVKDMIITSDGERYPSIWNAKPQYRRLQKRLLRLQRKASRQYRMNKQGGKKWREVATNNWRKTQTQCATIQQRLADMRKDYIHRVTDELTEQYDAIFIEDLNVKGMTAKAKPKKREDGKGYKQNGRKRKSGLSRNILQSSPGEIARQLEYKCNWRGKTFAKVGRFFPSSKTCSACGEGNKELELKDRTWTCSNCGVEHDRDKNAAINIKVQGFQVLQKAKTA
jgi:putative transposase